MASSGGEVPASQRGEVPASQRTPEKGDADALLDSLEQSAQQGYRQILENLVLGLSKL